MQYTLSLSALLAGTPSEYNNKEGKICVRVPDKGLKRARV